jgi:uncharacterized membrane protein YphA (DoxX/SURF4 family)
MVVLLLFVSLLLAGLAQVVKRPVPNAYQWFTIILRYYLAYQLLQYGFNKVFKWQFFLPEPNIVYTELGQLQPDLLYWSAVGSSYRYTVFLGMVEVFAALLLLFRKTYRIGSIASLIIMANVVSINFGFNISVKLFSSFLLLLSLILIWPALTTVYTLLIGKPTKPLGIGHQISRGTLYYLTKALVIVLLFADSLYLYAASGNWNDDTVERPPLHGAYEVIKAPEPWTHIFFHRKGYFITKDTSNKLMDYQLFFESTEQRIQTTHLNDTRVFDYRLTNENELRLWTEKDSIIARKLPYRQLPIFQSKFDWWVD